jgi:hypothetical protein
MDTTLKLCSSLCKLYKERNEQRLSSIFSVFQIFLCFCWIRMQGSSLGGPVMYHVALKRAVFLFTSQSPPCILTTPQAHQMKPNWRPHKCEHQYIHNIAQVALCIYRLCGLVVKVPGYRFRGLGSIPGAARFFLRSSGSGTGSTQPRDDNWGAISRK